MVKVIVRHQGFSGMVDFFAKFALEAEVLVVAGKMSVNVSDDFESPRTILFETHVFPGFGFLHFLPSSSSCEVKFSMVCAPVRSSEI